MTDYPLARVALIAGLCHAANAAFCGFLGDNSQKDWEAAPEWQRESAVNGVLFHLANPDAGDAASHENWMAVKLADGWVYGEKKDEKKKTHPCLVPFDQLPADQQFKDRLFRTLVHAALPLLAEPDATVGELAAIKRADDLANIVERLEGELANAHAAPATLDELIARLITFGQEHETREAGEEHTALALRISAARAGAEGAVDRLQLELADRGTELANVRDELRTAQEDLEAARAKLKSTAADGKRQAKGKGKSVAARKLGDVFSSPETASYREGIRLAIEDGDGPLELVFSTGTTEVIELEPLEAEPPAFTRIRGGMFRLERAVTVKPSADVRVRGVALVKDDKQIGWCGFPDPVTILAHQEHKFDRQIFF